MPLNNVGDAVREFKGGSLHSGKGGPRVRNRKQAIAIGLSAERRRKKLHTRRGQRAPVQRRMAGGR
jgi:hypothetical protein